MARRGLLRWAFSLTATVVSTYALDAFAVGAGAGAGLVVGRSNWLGAGEPYPAGGGAVRYVATRTTL